MSDESSANPIERAIEAHRTRSLLRLNAEADDALGRAFPYGPGPASKFVAQLARAIARDMTGLGLPVHTGDRGAVPAGVWLAPEPQRPGVIVSWTQHDASAGHFGAATHLELQRQMSFVVFEILHTLGYAATAYLGGDAHIVTAFRPGSPTAS